MATYERARRRAGYDATSDAYYGRHMSAKDRAAQSSARMQQQLAEFANNAKSSAAAVPTTDPEMQAIQREAVKKLQGVYSREGLDPATQARLNQANYENAGQLQSDQMTLEDALRRSGQSIGSGAAISLQDSNIQRAADRAANQGYQNVALGEQQRMAALGEASGQAGRIEGANFGRQFQTAQAQDQWAQMIQQLVQQGYTVEQATALGEAAQNQQAAGQAGASAAAIAAAIAASAGAAACWVAREIYGETNPQWVYARHYIFNVWHGRVARLVQGAYLRYGERLARFIRFHPMFKSWIKPLFDVAAERGRVSFA